MTIQNLDPFTRLWDRVDTSGECWLYEGGSKVRGGYRQMFSHRSEGRVVLKLVHRVVWETVHGPVPKGMEIRHTCDVGNCVRLDHMTVGTRYENEHDKDPRRVESDRRRTTRVSA